MAWNDGLVVGSPAHGIASSLKTRIRVVAGPGTGKSFAMKRRVSRLLESGVPPAQVLAVTFTRVAADDLHRELTQLGIPGANDLRGRTLHSLGMHILNRHHVLAVTGRVARPLNRFEQEALLADLAANHNGIKRCKALVNAYTAAWAQAQGDAPGFAPGSPEEQFAIDILAWLEFHRGMLIGEIIPYLLHYLHHNPICLELSEFTNVLVDEYQDLNQAEQTIVTKLGSSGEITIVGDDDQSIYSFKFANPQGIRDWHTHHPGLDDFQLLECHRCPIQVVSMANSLISMNRERVPRALTPVAANGLGVIRQLQFVDFEREANWIADEVERLLQSGLAVAGDVIVLIQRGRLGGVIRDALRLRNVSCKSYYDENQLDTSDAQERFAFLKLLLDNEDRVALRYLLGANNSNMRAPAYARLRGYCEQHGISPWGALCELSEGAIRLPNTKGLVDRFGTIVAELDNLRLYIGDLAQLVDELFPPVNPLVDDVRELALHCAAAAGDASELLSAMMEELTQPDVPPTVEEVRIMSLHKSKGLSSHVVFVAGCVDGILPQIPDDGSVAAKAASLEEQRRLFFVAMTRVKASPALLQPGRLYLTYSVQMTAALAYSTGVKPASVSFGTAKFQPSRFLRELGPDAPQPEAV